MLVLSRSSHKIEAMTGSVSHYTPPSANLVSFLGGKEDNHVLYNDSHGPKFRLTLPSVFHLPHSSVPSSSIAQAISFLDVCLLEAGVYLIKRLLDSRRYCPLPHGPIGWPVIGNLFQLSTEKSWEDFAALNGKHGTQFLPMIPVILNSFKAISAIFEKQSLKCSDRPHMTMASN
ncbi:hypothetical protein J3R82DRAFT_10925 [Butyriboletus roseoflavus]|nr:hypothetical protein J3R82DRAFT_10925 [Butyriboletus roseoflavus]